MWWDHIQVGRALSRSLSHARSPQQAGRQQPLPLPTALLAPLFRFVWFVHTMAGHKICAFLIQVDTCVCVCVCMYSYTYLCACLFICQFVCEAATCFDNFFILLKWIELFCAYRKLRQLQSSTTLTLSRKLGYVVCCVWWGHLTNMQINREGGVC